MAADPSETIDLLLVRHETDFPEGIDANHLADFLHENMKPYEDTPEDVRRGIDDCLRPGGPQQGFILLAVDGRELVGALVMLSTGMRGYVPENILLFVGVRPSRRGAGIGGLLVKRALTECDGQVKLHVEYDNPALRLYERQGFKTKYAEMRFSK